jgi:hypothetical protein
MPAPLWRSRGGTGSTTGRAETAAEVFALFEGEEGLGTFKTFTSTSRRAISKALVAADLA